MRDASALIATVDRVAGVATVTVRGELEPPTYSRLQDRLTWVVENGPRRLVLDLGVSDRFAVQLIDLIAAVRRQLAVDCLLEVRSANPALRNLLKLAGLPGVRVTAARQEAEPVRLDGHGQGSRVPAPVRVPGQCAHNSGARGRRLANGDVADIIELVLAGQQRILLTQRALRDAGRPGGQRGSASALATVWDRLADMIEVHTAAEEEICYLPMVAASSWSREQMQDAVAELGEIRDAAGEARLLPVCSRSWWRAVTAALSACVEHFDHQEQGVLADFRSRVDRTLRQQLGGQWSAFVTARICDLVPGGQVGDAACQRCQWPLPVSHWHVLDSKNLAVSCTCPCCYQLYLWAEEGVI
jgi:anti-sigma B factor antagonist